MHNTNQFSLLRQNRFAPFFWTQFFGAMNDNVFKTAALVVLAFDAAAWTTMPASLITNLIPALFILPYILLSATAGQLADKFEKSALARQVKWFELGIMVIAAFGWWAHSLPVLLGCIVGMGVHSTIFGPVKYAYLPQQLKPDELTGGNGVIEMGTFVGILLGEILGAYLAETKPVGVFYVAATTIAISIFGLVASYKIPKTLAPEPDLKVNWNPISETIRNIGFSRKNRPVFLSMLGNSWFWFYGAIVLAQFPVFAKDYLHGDQSLFVLLLTVFSLGIGVGSLLCERLSGRKVEIGLVPFGSIGLTLFGIDLYFASEAYTNSEMITWVQFLAQDSAIRILFDIVLIGVFGGLFIVPLFALIQTRCDPKHISRTIAGMNILNALFMVAASGLAIFLLGRGFTIPQIFLATALMNAVVSIYIFSLVPEFLMRFMAWLLIHTLHSVETVDTDLIPDEGPAVAIANHVSYLDAIVIGAASPRPIRFVMDHRIFKLPIFGWFFRIAKCIPIASAKDDPWLMEKAFVDIAKALHDGELVCIFPEGRLTTTGEMNEFKGGIAKIIGRSKVPVIPMALRGLWGHPLSRSKDNVFERTFRKGFRSKLALVVGKPVAPDDATPELLQQKVQELRGTWK